MDIGFADKVALAESRDRSRPFGLKVPLDVKRQDAHRRAAVRRSNRCLVALYLSQICKTSLQCAYLRQIAVPLGRPGDARRLRLDSAQGLCKLKPAQVEGKPRFVSNTIDGLGSTVVTALRAHCGVSRVSCPASGGLSRARPFS